MQDIDLRDLEKMRSLLESLEETNYFREDGFFKRQLINNMSSVLRDIDMEIDSFFDEIDSNDYDQPDPNEVLQSVLDMRTEEFKKELEN
jgi:hypothetical protein